MAACWSLDVDSSFGPIGKGSGATMVLDDERGVGYKLSDSLQGLRALTMPFEVYPLTQPLSSHPSTKFSLWTALAVGNGVQTMSVMPNPSASFHERSVAEFS
jgi:hypothetical protein